MTNDIVDIFVQLLNEGTFTARPTKAIDLGNGQYRILAIPTYDPEDEIWEFPPNCIVRLRKQSFGLMATDDVDPVTVLVRRKGEDIETAFVMEAVPIGEGLFKILPPYSYSREQDCLEFQPGDVVLLERIERAGKERLLAVSKNRQ